MTGPTLEETRSDEGGTTSVTMSAGPSRGRMLGRIADYKIGSIPLPLYLAMALIVVGAALQRRLPSDMIGGFAAIMIMGIPLGHIGARVPLLRSIGGPAILSLFVPSALLGWKMLDPELAKAVTALMKTANFLYLYIACLVAGSMLGMNRRILIQGFARMFVPLLVGSVASVAAGIATGSLLGYAPRDTFFYIVIPIVGGGIGEGILPLSIAYSEILHRPQSELIALMIPAALIGNVVAITSSGLLKHLGEKRPHLSGRGLLVRTHDADVLVEEQNAERPIDLRLMGSGLLIACTFFILGSLLAPYVGIPGPILMILGAAACKVLRVVPASMEQGAHQMYRFVSLNLTFPLLAGLGVVYVPWADLVGSFTIPYFCICAATVLAMVASGFFIGFVMRMYPVEAAIVTACHSGLGGTGDVAILSASNRMGLMPFAQIATRIGGASMVVIAVFLLKLLR